jgi:hypothetical protein
MMKSRRMRWARHVALTREKSNERRTLVENPEGKSPLGRNRRRWENNNNMDLRKIAESSMDLADPAQDRDQWNALVNKVTNLQIPYILGNM